MVNGYVTLDLASTNIYKESLGAIKAQKPIMVVDLPNVYFADTIKATTIDGDDVVQITKGGKTITINDVNAVSSEGDIQQLAPTIHHHNLIGNVRDGGNSTDIEFSVTIDNFDETPITLQILFDKYIKVAKQFPLVARVKDSDNNWDLIETFFFDDTQSQWKFGGNYRKNGSTSVSTIYFRISADYQTLVGNVTDNIVSE